MATGWRRAFCTSIPKEDRDAGISSDKQQQVNPTKNSSSSPRISSKFGFFSTPSTPRLLSQPVDRPSLRCRTSAAAAVPNSSSNPSSPRSPSGFSLLRASLRLSRTRCGICEQSVKAGQGTAIFTAECSHTFHFPCIAAHVKNHRRSLVCPVCSATWKELPLLSNSDNNDSRPKLQGSPKSDLKAEKVSSANAKRLRVYDDDEPLLSPCSVSRFNPIPESDESNEESQQDDEPVEFRGFFVGSASSPVSPTPSSKPSRNNVELSLLPESAIVSVNKSYGIYAVVLKVKAPRAPVNGSPARAPVDLVTVLDVSACMNGQKVHVMKRAMRLVISSLSDSDRLSIIAFSATSKRLLPLRRMNAAGRRAARRIVDAVGSTGQPASANDALRKAVKVLEDRREKNLVASVFLLSDGQDQRMHPTATGQNKSYPVVTSTRSGQIPIHAVGCGSCDHFSQDEEAFGKHVMGLLRVAVQDLRLQLGLGSGSDPAEITAVYSLDGRPADLGSGLVRVGDLYSEEERELLVEIKARGVGGSRHVLSVGYSYVDPPSQERVYSTEKPIPVPRPQSVGSPSIQRLKNLHVIARAIEESRGFVGGGDLSGASRLLSSARALSLQSGLGSEFFRSVEAELTELQRLRQAARRRRAGGREEEKAEILTPTSAWRAAERLAKVAIMRKSMNRVSDLHGFEDARF